jgi:integrase
MHSMMPDLEGLDPEVLSAHLGHLRLLGRAEGSIYSRCRALARMCAILPVPLLDATPADILAWRAGLTISGNAIVHYASHAREFYAWACEAGLIPVSPVQRLPLPPLIKGLPRPISERDLMAALASAPPRVRPWLVLAAWAGLRACEIAYLRRDRVLDTASPPVLLVAADATKGTWERIVPASEFVMAELWDAGLPSSGWVYRRRDGSPGPNAPWTVSHLCNEHMTACGIGATLHQLRHRFGTQAYRASGRDLRLTQELMGHKRPETTALYTDWDRPEATAAVEALPAPGRLRSVASE